MILLQNHITISILISLELQPHPWPYGSKAKKIRAFQKNYKWFWTSKASNFHTSMPYGKECDETLMASNLMLDMQYLILKIFWKYRGMVFQMANKVFVLKLTGLKFGSWYMFCTFSFLRNLLKMIFIDKWVNECRILVLQRFLCSSNFYNLMSLFIHFSHPMTITLCTMSKMFKKVTFSIHNKQDTVNPRLEVDI